MATSKNHPAARTDVSVNPDGTLNALFHPLPKGAGGENSRGEATYICRTEGSFTFVRNVGSTSAGVCPNNPAHTVAHYGAAPE